MVRLAHLAGPTRTRRAALALLGVLVVAVVAMSIRATIAVETARGEVETLLADLVGRPLRLGGAVKTQTHNDRDHNLACVLAGRRRFLLFPPEQVANLFVGPLDNPPPLSLVDPEAPDLDRFPRFQGAMAAARVALLDPGDALFIPRYWWHHVTSLDPYNAMVNYWWDDDAAGAEAPY